MKLPWHWLVLALVLSANGLLAADSPGVVALRKKADAGDAVAQAELGKKYAFGDGLPKDILEAVGWFRKAAAQGLPEAQYHLGMAFLGGNGHPKIPAEAMQWFLTAANQGHAKAAGMIGGIYLSGDGVPRDPMQAYIWLTVSESQGNAGAAMDRATAARSLTVVQKLDGTSQARELIAKLPGASTKWKWLSIAAAGIAIIGWIYWRRRRQTGQSTGG